MGFISSLIALLSVILIVLVVYFFIRRERLIRQGIHTAAGLKGVSPLRVCIIIGIAIPITFITIALVLKIAQSGFSDPDGEYFFGLFFTTFLLGVPSLIAFSIIGLVLKKINSSMQQNAQNLNQKEDVWLKRKQ